MQVVDEHRKQVKAGEEGVLVIRKPWPAMMRSIHSGPDRFVLLKGDLSTLEEQVDGESSSREPRPGRSFGVPGATPSTRSHLISCDFAFCFHVPFKPYRRAK